MKRDYAGFYPILLALLLLVVMISAPGRQQATAQPSVIATVSVPLPISLGYNPTSGNMYVGSFTNGISVISGTSPIASISQSQTGYSPRAFAYDNSNGLEYVAAGNSLSAITGISKIQSVGQGGISPQSVSYDPSNGNVIVANLDQLLVLSGSNALLANFSVMPRVGGLAFDTLDNYTYSSYIIQNATGYDTGTNLYVVAGDTLAGGVSLGNDGGGFVPPVYDACHNYVYEANSDLSSVTVVWGTQILGSVSVQSEPAAMAYDSSNDNVYVANSGAGTVSILSGAQSLGNLAVGANPTAIAYDPYDGYVYVADSGANEVSVIDGNGVVATIPVGTDPIAIAFDAANNDLYVANNGSGTVSIIPSVGPPLSGSTSSTPCSPVPVVQKTTSTTSTTISTTVTTSDTSTQTSNSNSATSSTSSSTSSTSSSSSSGTQSTSTSTVSTTSEAPTSSTSSTQTRTTLDGSTSTISSGSVPTTSSSVQSSGSSSVQVSPAPASDLHVPELLLPALVILVGILAAVWIGVTAVRRNRVRGMT